MSEPITPTSNMALKKRQPPLTTRDQLAQVVGITPDGIKKQLDKLKKVGKIRHVGATQKGHWEIIG